MRLESQLSRMNCQTFSTGLSSGHFGGSRMMVILAGTRRRVDKCQPAWSTRRLAWAAGATVAAIGPAAGDLVLLADAGLVGEPDFYRVAVKRLLARNCLQARGEVFLKS